MHICIVIVSWHIGHSCYHLIGMNLKVKVRFFSTISKDGTVGFALMLWIARQIGYNCPDRHHGRGDSGRLSIDECFHPLVLLFRRMTIIFTLKHRDTWKVGEFAYVQVPGYLSSWKAHE